MRFLTKRFFPVKTLTESQQNSLDPRSVTFCNDVYVPRADKFLGVGALVLVEGGSADALVGIVAEQPSAANGQRYLVMGVTGAVHYASPDQL
jgi:hypothetical protein